MGYLDNKGLSRLWEKIKAALSFKQDKLAAGEGITIEGDEIRVTTPVKGLTQAEYDALTDKEKMSGTLYVTPQKPVLPEDGDGAVPTGAVISFLGMNAPAGYLICDGAAYSIANYARLAAFIREQFGASDYFGGDGENTFAVPDMRNLFLRGYHGSAAALSGNIGAKQEGTKHVYVASADGSDIFITGPDGKRVDPENVDSVYTIRDSIYKAGWQSGLNEGNHASHYTSRPVNMAVLYCIKI